jgi:uncharacterized phage infection (PIP) family protein YhgE
MGAMFTGSCLAGAAAANFAFKRSARGLPQIARPLQTGVDARLARLEELLRDVQKAQGAQATLAAQMAENSAPTDLTLISQEVAPLLKGVEEGLMPLATQIAELDYKVAAGAGLQRKILSTLDAVRETQRNELLILRQEIQDQLAESARSLGAASERMRQGQKDMTRAVRDSVKTDIKAVVRVWRGCADQSWRTWRSSRGSAPPLLP